MPKFEVTLETLKSKPIKEKAIENGISLFNNVRIKFEESDGGYRAKIDDHGESRGVFISFTKDGCDLGAYFCHCSSGRNGVICKHIVAAVLAVQGGVAETKIILGKTVTVSAIVGGHNTARAVGSGSAEVFATPMMVALMERAAFAVLSDGLAAGQTSVGTHIDVSHDAASPLGAEISATATVTAISGRKIEFAVKANDNTGEIGRGTHTRVIVDEDKFMARAETRLVL
jgi:predicted thioesterase